MRRSVMMVLASAAALAACQHKPVCTPSGGIAAGPPPPDWHDAVSDPDHVKLRATRDAMIAGVQAARDAGFGARIDAAGRLFDIDYSQDGAALKLGRYTCRITTLGSKTAGRSAYVEEPARHCAVTAGEKLQHFNVLDGPQRLNGKIYPDTDARTVFLGTIQLADEASPLHYSRDVDRDTVGAIQRLGPARWRMVIAHPAWESIVEVMEIVPAA
jgi:hypothetical protein